MILTTNVFNDGVRVPLAVHLEPYQAR